MENFEDRLEKAARELCDLRGINPEERMGFSDNSRHLVARFRPRWKNVAEEIKTQIDRIHVEDLIYKHQLMFKGD